MTKILFIAYFFPPIGGAGVQRSLKFVRYLPENGYQPIVITGPGSTNDRWTPEDSALLNEVPVKTAIYRTKSTIPESKSRLLNKGRNLLGLKQPFSKWWVASAIELGRRALSEEKCQLIFATMSPFESAEVAAQLSVETKIPWVADLRDPWALDEMRIFPTSIHRKAELLRMQKLLASASVIIMNTPKATEALKKYLPALAKKRIITLTNGYDSSDFEGTVEQQNNSKFTIVHTGYLHTALGLQQLKRKKLYKILGAELKEVDILTRSHIFLIKAIEQWLEEKPDVRKDLELLFLGTTSQKDHAIAEDSNISDIIHFKGYQPHIKTINSMRTADLLFLPMHNVQKGEFATIVPGKTYEYMASGRPILAAVPNGDAKDFLIKCGTGFISAPDDCEGMIRNLKQVYHAWKSNQSPDSNENFVKQFERKELTKTLASAFNSLLT